jgi:hypothetical protein
MNSCRTGWLYIKCWKWPPPSTTDTSEHDVACCPTFIAEHNSQCWWPQVRFCLSRLLWCKIYFCTLSPSGSPKERNLEVSSLLMEGATGCVKGLSCSGARACSVTASATQHHVLRLRQITHGQYWHEQEMLLKEVPSSSDHSFMNYRQKWPGHSTWIILYKW